MKATDSIPHVLSHVSDILILVNTILIHTHTLLPSQGLTAIAATHPAPQPEAKFQ